MDGAEGQRVNSPHLNLGTFLGTSSRLAELRLLVADDLTLFLRLVEQAVFDLGQVRSVHFGKHERVAVLHHKVGRECGAGRGIGQGEVGRRRERGGGKGCRNRGDIVERYRERRRGCVRCGRGMGGGGGLCCDDALRRSRIERPIDRRLCRLNRCVDRCRGRLSVGPDRNQGKESSKREPHHFCFS